MQNKMRNILSIHTWLDLPFGVKIALLFLSVPSMAFATIATPEVAVPLKTAPKTTLLRTQPYTSTTNYAPTVGYSTAVKGNYNPLRTVSSGTVRSWNAGSLQSAALGGNAVVSATSSSTVTSASLSVPQVGVTRTRRSTMATSTFATQQSGPTKRRAMGDPEGGGGENEVDSAPQNPSLGQIWQDPVTGKWYTWNGSGWEETAEKDLPQDTPTPIGDIPFCLLVLLLAGYVVVSRLRRSD